MASPHTLKDIFVYDRNAVLRNLLHLRIPLHGLFTRVIDGFEALRLLAGLELRVIPSTHTHSVANQIAQILRRVRGHIRKHARNTHGENLNLVPNPDESSIFLTLWGFPVSEARRCTPS